MGRKSKRKRRFTFRLCQRKLLTNSLSQNFCSFIFCKVTSVFVEVKLEKIHFANFNKDPLFLDMNEHICYKIEMSSAL